MSADDKYFAKALLLVLIIALGAGLASLAFHRQEEQIQKIEIVPQIHPAPPTKCYLVNYGFMSLGYTEHVYHNDNGTITFKDNFRGGEIITVGGNYKVTETTCD